MTWFGGELMLSRYGSNPAQTACAFCKIALAPLRSSAFRALFSKSVRTSTGVSGTPVALISSGVAITVQGFTRRGGGRLGIDRTLAGKKVKGTGMPASFLVSHDGAASWVDKVASRWQARGPVTDRERTDEGVRLAQNAGRRGWTRWCKTARVRGSV